MPRTKAPHKSPSIAAYELYRLRMANALKQSRLITDLSQREAANRALCSQVQWQRYEDPKALAANPRLSELVIIGEAVSLDLGKMLGDPWERSAEDAEHVAAVLGPPCPHCWGTGRLDKE